MATKKKSSTAVVSKPKGSAVSTNVRPVGRGFEEADSDSYAIPFITVLQKSTPWADPDDDAYIKGAKAGMFINTVTLELFDEVEVIPVVYKRTFNRWAPRDSGGGFKGTFAPSAIQGMEATNKIAQDEDGRWYFALPDGSINEKKCDILTDTRMHFVLQVKEDGSMEQVLVSLSRTQLKKSKNWMSLMQRQGGDMWENTYIFKTKDEENDKGKWKGVVIEMARESEAAERETAENFYTSVIAGKVAVKHEQAGDSED